MAITRPTNFLAIRPAGSNTAGNVLVAADLGEQEIGINYADKVLFYKIGGAFGSIDLGGVTINDNATSTATDEVPSSAIFKVLWDRVENRPDIIKVADTTGLNAIAEADRPALTLARVLDDGDGKWAMYQNDGTAALPDWTKIGDEDGLASAATATALGYTASPTNGTVNNNAGTDAVIPLADETNAGLMKPSTGTAGLFVVQTSTGYEAVAPAAAGTF